MIAIRRMEEQKRVGAEIITIDRVRTPSAVQGSPPSPSQAEVAYPCARWMM